MSIRLGSRIVAGGGSDINRSALYLFDWKWADHQVNQAEWLRADTFTWHDGTTYQVAYQHLVDDIDGKTLQTETIAGTTISFYLATDGHKICPANQEANIGTIFQNTGVAWYYILDTTNTRFKLPRTTHNVVGVRDTVGKYVEAELPNLKGYLGSNGTWSQVDGTLFTQSSQGNESHGWDGSSTTRARFTMDASQYNSIYKDSATTVQPPATQMYLYFYVCEFTQTATVNTAGINAEMFNAKADLSMFQVVNALPANPDPNVFYFIVN